MKALAVAIFAAGCGQSVTASGAQRLRDTRPGFTIEYAREDVAGATQVAAAIGSGLEYVNATFGNRVGAFNASVFPSQSQMIDHLDQLWRTTLPRDCWMVAAAYRDELSVLSPPRWAREACSHSGDDTAHVRRVVWHEVVHLLHSQRNTSFLNLPRWFREGLAVYASGQYAPEYRETARSTVAAGFHPTSAAAMDQSAASYALGGSMLAYLLETKGFGLEPASILEFTSWASLLTRIGIGEAELMESWRTWLLAGG